MNGRPSATADAHQTPPCPVVMLFGLSQCNIFPVKKSSSFPQAANYSWDDIKPLFQSWRLCPPLLTLWCPEDFWELQIHFLIQTEIVSLILLCLFSCDSFLIKVTQAFWVTEEGSRELCCQQRKQQASKQIFPSYIMVHRFSPQEARAPLGKAMTILPSW